MDRELLIAELDRILLLLDYKTRDPAHLAQQLQMPFIKRKLEALIKILQESPAKPPEN